MKHFASTYKKVIILKILLYFSFITFAQFPTNSFGPKIDFAIGNNPQGIAIADLNSDGKPDILAANITSNSITIKLNTTGFGLIGSTSFGTNVTLNTLTNSPQQIFPADLNHDGKIDFIVGYSTGNSFSIFINNYDSGVFNSSRFLRTDILAGTGPAGVVAADLNNDGNLDLVVSNYSSNNIYVYRNLTSTSTSITLSNPTSFITGSGPNSVAAGDIDNDGFTDLVTTNWNSNSISVFRNTTSNINTVTFTNSTHSVQSNPYWARIENLDKDNFLEVICSNYGSGSISIFDKTAATGIFFNPRIDKNLGGVVNVQASTINDLNGDYIKDIAVTNSTINAIGAFRSKDTTGILNSNYFSNPTHYSTGNSPVGAVSSDLDGDQRPDLVVGNYSSNSISILKNHNLSDEPTLSSTIVNVSTNLLSSEITLNLNKGNGTKRIVISRISSNMRFEPKDTSWYNANDTFGFGSLTGPGNFVVYSDTGSTLKVSGLSAGQTYTFDVYEFNGYGGFCNYLTSSFASVTQTLGVIYYSKSTGMLNDTSTWGLNLDGTGPNPSSFFNPNSIYVITNNSAPSINSSWIITGTNSMIRVGNGLQPLNFTIPSGTNLFVDSIVVSSQATITFVGGFISNKAFFDTLSNAQFISSNFQNIPGYSYFNLVAAGGIKNLSNNVLVRNALNMLTTINTGAFLITLGTSNINPGVLNRSNGTINGKLRRYFPPVINSGSSGLFPIGTNSNYRPIQIEHTSAPTNGGYLIAEFISNPGGNSGLPIYDFSIFPLIEINKTSVNGFWKLTSEGLNGGTYTLNATGSGFIGVNNPANIRIVKRQTNGAWIIQGTAITGTGSIAVPVAGRTGLQGFGEFTFAGDSTDNVLPLSWHSFEVFPYKESNLLVWKTLNEINTHSFNVERKSEFEKDFSLIYSLPSNNSTKLNSYSYVDLKSNFVMGKLYYRIKQIDLDGTFSYSKVIILNDDFNSEDIQSKVFPNPAASFINCTFCNDQTLIYDLNGKLMNIKYELGTYNISHLPNGLYYIRAGENSTRFIKE